MAEIKEVKTEKTTVVRESAFGSALSSGTSRIIPMTIPMTTQ